MPRFRFENRVKENANDTGTGDFSLGGAQKTYRSFGDVCDDQDTFPYTIAHDAADEREVGIGKYDQSTDSIVRQTVLESSNNDSLVDFGAGTKVVAMTAPKERLPILDSAASSGDVPVFDGNEHAPQQSFPNQMRFDAGIDTRGDVVMANDTEITLTESGGTERSGFYLDGNDLLTLFEFPERASGEDLQVFAKDTTAASPKSTGGSGGSPASIMDMRARPPVIFLTNIDATGDWGRIYQSHAGLELTALDGDKITIGTETSRLNEGGIPAVLINSGSSPKMISIDKNQHGYDFEVRTQNEDKIIRTDFDQDSVGFSATPLSKPSYKFGEDTFHQKRLVVGADDHYAVDGTVTEVQSHEVSGDAGYAGVRWQSANAFGPNLFLAKSRSGTVGTTGTAVQDGDTIALMRYHGDDGTDFEEAARIAVEVTGTVADNDVPGLIGFEAASNGSLIRSMDVRSDAVAIAPNQGTPGSSSNPIIEIGSNGAGLFVDPNGDIFAVDADGNTNSLMT